MKVSLASYLTPNEWFSKPQMLIVQVHRHKVLFHRLVVFLESLQIHSPVLQWGMMVWCEVVLLTQKMILRSHATHFKDTLWSQLRCMKKTLFKCDIYICLPYHLELLFFQEQISIDTHSQHSTIKYFSRGFLVFLVQSRYLDPFWGLQRLVGMGMVLKRINMKQIYIYIYPWGSMYGIFTYIWFIFMVNVGIYTIHGSSGYIYIYIPNAPWDWNIYLHLA